MAPTKQTKKKKDKDDESIYDETTYIEVCPCNNWQDCDYIGCEFGGCESWWHYSCVGLQSLTEEQIGCVNGWKCPRCVME